MTKIVACQLEYGDETMQKFPIFEGMDHQKITHRAFTTFPILQIDDLWRFTVEYWHEKKEEWLEFQPTKTPYEILVKLNKEHPIRVRLTNRKSFDILVANSNEVNMPSERQIKVSMNDTLHDLVGKIADEFSKPIDRIRLKDVNNEPVTMENLRSDCRIFFDLNAEVLLISRTTGETYIQAVAMDETVGQFLLRFVASRDLPAQSVNAFELYHNFPGDALREDIVVVDIEPNSRRIQLYLTEFVFFEVMRKPQESDVEPFKLEISGHLAELEKDIVKRYRLHNFDNGDATFRLCYDAPFVDYDKTLPIRTKVKSGETYKVLLVEYARFKIFCKRPKRFGLLTTTDVDISDGCAELYQQVTLRYPNILVEGLTISNPGMPVFTWQSEQTGPFYEIGIKRGDTPECVFDNVPRVLLYACDTRSYARMVLERKYKISHRLWVKRKYRIPTGSMVEVKYKHSERLLFKKINFKTDKILAKLTIGELRPELMKWKHFSLVGEPKLEIYDSEFAKHQIANTVQIIELLKDNIHTVKVFVRYCRSQPGNYDPWKTTSMTLGAKIRYPKKIEKYLPILPDCEDDEEETPIVFTQI